MRRNQRQWFIRVPWGKLYLVSFGHPDGEPVFMVHGRQDSSTCFELLIDQMIGDYYYVALDMPGNGLSDAFPHVSNVPLRPGDLPYAVVLNTPPTAKRPFIEFNKYNQALYYTRKSPRPGGPKLQRFHFLYAMQLALSHLGWDKFIFMGHSMGCEQGLFYNAINPGQITKMILLDAGPTLMRMQIEDPMEYHKSYYESYYENYHRENFVRKMHTRPSAIQALKRLRDLNDDQCSALLRRNFHKLDDWHPIEAWHPNAALQLAPQKSILSSIEKEQMPDVYFTAEAEGTQLPAEDSSIVGSSDEDDTPTAGTPVASNRISKETQTPRLGDFSNEELGSMCRVSNSELGPTDRISNKERGPIKRLSNAELSPTDRLSNKERGPTDRISNAEQGPIGGLSNEERSPVEVHDEAKAVTPSTSPCDHGKTGQCEHCDQKTRGGEVGRLIQQMRVSDDEELGYLSWDNRLKNLAPTNFGNEYYFQLFKTIPPTLLIAASDGAKYMPPNSKWRQGAKELLDKMATLDNFQRVDVEGSHDVHFTHPERVAPHINKFLNEKVVSKL